MGHGEWTAIWNSLSFYLRSAVGMDPKPTNTLLDFTWDATTQMFGQTPPVEVPAVPACLRQLNVYLDTSPGALRGSRTEFAICFRPKACFDLVVDFNTLCSQDLADLLRKCGGPKFSAVSAFLCLATPGVLKIEQLRKSCLAPRQRQTQSSSLWLPPFRCEKGIKMKPATPPASKHSMTRLQQEQSMPPAFSLATKPRKARPPAAW